MSSSILESSVWYDKRLQEWPGDISLWLVYDLVCNEYVIQVLLKSPSIVTLKSGLLPSFDFSQICKICLQSCDFRANKRQKETQVAMGR